jgi:hypothetical protein
VGYAGANNSDRPLQLDVDASGGMRRCDKSISETSDPRACPGANTPDNGV